MDNLIKNNCGWFLRKIYVYFSFERNPHPKYTFFAQKFIASNFNGRKVLLLTLFLLLFFPFESKAEDTPLTPKTCLDSKEACLKEIQACTGDALASAKSCEAIKTKQPKTDYSKSTHKLSSQSAADLAEIIASFEYVAGGCAAHLQICKNSCILLLKLNSPSLSKHIKLIEDVPPRDSQKTILTALKKAETSNADNCDGSSSVINQRISKMRQSATTYQHYQQQATKTAVASGGDGAGESEDGGIGVVAGAAMLGAAGLVGAGITYFVTDNSEEFEQLEKDDAAKAEEIEALKQVAEAKAAEEKDEEESENDDDDSGGGSESTASATECTDQLMAEETQERNALITTCWSGGNKGKDCQDFYQLYCDGKSEEKNACEAAIKNVGVNTGFCIRFANEGRCGNSGNSGSPTCIYLQSLTNNCKSNYAHPDCLFRMEQQEYNKRCSEHQGDPVCTAVSAGTFASGEVRNVASANSTSIQFSATQTNFLPKATGDVNASFVNLRDRTTQHLLYECSPEIHGLQCEDQEP